MGELLKEVGDESFAHNIESQLKGRSRVTPHFDGFMASPKSSFFKRHTRHPCSFLPGKRRINPRPLHVGA